ncbi:MAG: NifU family protein [Planctomycetota bacterium]|jgi:Fe-S cluster biogenesis protein NfuA|nr:NifU family protein [Planctomycetota bacterium]
MSEETTIRITAEPQVIPSNCLFRVANNMFVGCLYTSDPEWANEWAPLAGNLFNAVPELKGVRINNSEVLISMKSTPSDWREVARSAGQAIREYLQAADVSVKEGALAAQQGDDLLRQKAQKVIDDTLNPSLASHGGWVEIQASDGKELFITMGGGCQGCGSAEMTMKQGVEVAIRDAVPEIEGIHDATDHTSGANPYM